jgi:hypothetical protein
MTPHKTPLREKFTTLVAWITLGLSFCQFAGLAAPAPARSAQALRGSLECSSDFRCEIKISRSDAP